MTLYCLFQLVGSVIFAGAPVEHWPDHTDKILRNGVICKVQYVKQEDEVLIMAGKDLEQSILTDNQEKQHLKKNNRDIPSSAW